MQLRSAIDGIRWPAVAQGRAAELLALLRQLEASQWLEPHLLQALQFHQLEALVAHARQIPFYAARLDAAGLRPGSPLDEHAWRRLPPLTRHDLQQQGAALHAPLPPSHGRTAPLATGGSTGIPVRTLRSEAEMLLLDALQIRDEVWNREDPTGTIARIRGSPFNAVQELRSQIHTEGGHTLLDWGPPMSLLYETGRVAMIMTTRPIHEQVAWLQRLRPDYLHTLPANLRLLLAHCREHGISLPLRAVWTTSEVVDPALRDACRQTFACRIVENYSAAETGAMALQCPEHEHLHVQSETHLLEVVDDLGRPCAPGEIGRVLVTPLHNFASPLLRYEIGDRAELGPPCPCGRGLPVLARLAGRTADVLRLEGGGHRRIDVANYALARIDAVREFQCAQVALDTVEVRLVAARPLTPAEEADIRARLALEMGADIRIVFAYRDSLPRTPAHKLRSFVSELP